MKCKACVNAGVCGFTTTITAESPDSQTVTLDLQTDCEKVRAFADALDGKEIDAYEEIAVGAEGVVLSAAREKLLGCCAACAVPIAAFKLVQVAARVALPRDVSISLETE